MDSNEATAQSSFLVKPCHLASGLPTLSLAAPHAGCSIASPNREFTPELSNPLSACWQNSWRVSVHAGRRRVHYAAGIHRAAAVGLVAKSITLSGAREKIAAAAFAPLQPRTDSEVILPAAMAGGNTGLVLCQVSGQ
jgi:hypothetical protein